MTESNSNPVIADKVDVKPVGWSILDTSHHRASEAHQLGHEMQGKNADSRLGRVLDQAANWASTFFGGDRLSGDARKASKYLKENRPNVEQAASELVLKTPDAGTDRGQQIGELAEKMAPEKSMPTVHASVEALLEMSDSTSNEAAKQLVSALTTEQVSKEDIDKTNEFLRKMGQERADSFSAMDELISAMSAKDSIDILVYDTMSLTEKGSEAGQAMLVPDAKLLQNDQGPDGKFKWSHKLVGLYGRVHAFLNHTVPNSVTEFGHKANPFEKFRTEVEDRVNRLLPQFASEASFIAGNAELVDLARAGVIDPDMLRNRAGWRDNLDPNVIAEVESMDRSKFLNKDGTLEDQYKVSTEKALALQKFHKSRVDDLKKRWDADRSSWVGKVKDMYGASEIASRIPAPARELMVDMSGKGLDYALRLNDAGQLVVDVLVDGVEGQVSQHALEMVRSSEAIRNSIAIDLAEAVKAGDAKRINELSRAMRGADLMVNHSLLRSVSAAERMGKLHLEPGLSSAVEGVGALGAELTEVITGLGPNTSETFKTAVKELSAETVLVIDVNEAAKTIDGAAEVGTQITEQFIKDVFVDIPNECLDDDQRQEFLNRHSFVKFWHKVVYELPTKIGMKSLVENSRRPVLSEVLGDGATVNRSEDGIDVEIGTSQRMNTMANAEGIHRKLTEKVKDGQTLSVTEARQLATAELTSDAYQTYLEMEHRQMGTRQKLDQVAAAVPVVVTGATLGILVADKGATFAADQLRAASDFISAYTDKALTDWQTVGAKYASLYTDASLDPQIAGWAKPVGWITDKWNALGYGTKFASEWLTGAGSQVMDHAITRVALGGLVAGGTIHRWLRTVTNAGAFGTTSLRGGMINSPVSLGEAPTSTK